METIDYREELENIKKNIGELKEEIQKLQGLPDKIDTAVYQEEIIRDLHQELQQYKKGLIADISKGYVMSIINIYERLSDTCMHLGPSEEATDPASAKKLIENNILYISDMLEDEYSIERFMPLAGDPYKPKEHKAIRTVDTDDAAKANTIAECLSGGFRDEATGRVLRQARIVVYKLRDEQNGI
jgi:molecular chaperone GrpE (heat shock protein)